MTTSARFQPSAQYRASTTFHKIDVLPTFVCLKRTEKTVWLECSKFGYGVKRLKIRPLMDEAGQVVETAAHNNWSISAMDQVFG